MGRGWKWGEGEEIDEDREDDWDDGREFMRASESRRLGIEVDEAG